MKRMIARLARSRRVMLGSGALLVMLVSALWIHGQRAPLNKPLSALLPPGALIYLETPDFGGLLSRWNSSNEKRQWLISDNYSTLSQSRLLGRLAQAQDEFNKAANVSPQMQLLTQVACQETAFAFYDLGNLKFVYITKLDSKRLDANELWQKRPQYRQREVAGISFYERTDPDSKRTVSFASKDDFFVIASDSDLMVGSLALLAAQPAPSLDAESWFSEAKAAANGNDRPTLRLIYNMEQLVTKPQFRTYWIQQNVTEMNGYRSGICDLFETNTQFSEKRVLLRKTVVASVSDEQAVARLLSYVPQNRSFYQAWADPRRELLTDMVVQTFAGESVAGGRPNLYAPDVSTEAGAIGSVSDLETRVDVPPVKRGSQPSLDPLISGLLALKPVGALQIQGTTESGDRVFVIPQSTLVLAFAQPNRAAVETALEPARRALAVVGTPEWQRGDNSSSFGPIETLTVTSAGGNVVIISRGTSLADATGRGQRATAALTYAAGYNHELAFPSYTKLFTVLDAPKLVAEDHFAAPPFFSTNVRSLAASLPRLQGIQIQGREVGNTLTEEVIYQLK